MWFFEFDEIPPHLIDVVPGTSSRVHPNTSIQFNFNETVFYFELSLFRGEQSIVNDTFYPNSSSFVLWSQVSDDNYSVVITIYDFGGNQHEINYKYIVDGTPPTVQLTYSNNTSIKSGSIIQLIISEVISNYSYYQIDNQQKTNINTTSVYINLTLSEGIHKLSVYVEDSLGNNRTYEYVFNIDDLPIEKPISSLSSGSWYTSDTDVVKFYFNERPSLVLANWNNGTNVTLTILVVNSYMILQISGDQGRFYVWIELPKEDFKGHTLRLYVKDAAGNWALFNFKYFKVPSLSDLTLLFVLIGIIVAIVLCWKRNRIIGTVNIRVKKIKTKFMGEIVEGIGMTPRSKDEVEEETGDRVVFKKGEGKKPNKKELKKQKHSKLRKRKKRSS